MGIQTSAFLFDWGSDTLVHRDRIVAGGVLLFVSALIWWGLGRRIVAVVSTVIASASVAGRGHPEPGTHQD